MAEQMAKYYLFKLALRDEAVELLAKNVFPPNVSAKLCKSLHWPR